MFLVILDGSGWFLRAFSGCFLGVFVISWWIGVFGCCYQEPPKTAKNHPSIEQDACLGGVATAFAVVGRRACAQPTGGG